MWADSKIKTLWYRHLRLTSIKRYSNQINNQQSIIHFEKLKQNLNLESYNDWNSITKEQIQSIIPENKLLNKYSIKDIKLIGSTKIWEKEKINKILDEIKTKYNIKTSKEWNLLTENQIQFNSGEILLKLYSINEIKSMGIKSMNENKLIFKKRKSPGYWNENKNIETFLNEIKSQYNLKTPEDWNNLTIKQILDINGNRFLKNHSLHKIKLMGCPELKNLQFPSEYWNKIENLEIFLNEMKEKLNLKTPNDWNHITKDQIQLLGGNKILIHYNLFELKCLAWPNNKSEFYPLHSIEYKEIQNFIEKIREKLNLQTINDWNVINMKKIKELDENNFLRIFSLYEIKCLACPEGKEKFKPEIKRKPTKFWEENENIQNFLLSIKEKLNFQSPDDWNYLTTNHIRDFGGHRLLKKYSIYEIKCLACPEGKKLFKPTLHRKSHGYWDNKENIANFINKLRNHFNLQTIDDWNSITTEQIRSIHGSGLLVSLSLYDIKCLGFPEGKFEYQHESNRKSSGYWNNVENIKEFLLDVKKKLKLETIDDWNSITTKQIKLFGGSVLLDKYSIYEIKCLACPEGKEKFDNQVKPAGFWDNKENVANFLKKLEKKLNIKSSKDWHSITKHQIQSVGGNTLLTKYTLYELKSIAISDDEKFNLYETIRKSSDFWDKNENIQYFIDELKEKFNIKSINDWERISKSQIRLLGGKGLIDKYFNNKYDDDDIPSDLVKISSSINKINGRSSQRWLFLQIQKLFPHDEIVEDYFHSEISRKSGLSIQFDVFIVNKNIAFEYHGVQHYEDIPSAFAPLEMYQTRDREKLKLCETFGIQLIIIPYWWDNNLVSLQKTIEQKLPAINFCGI